MISIQLYAFGQITPDTSMQNKPDSTMLVSPDTTAQTFTNEKPSANQEVYKLKAASDIPVIAIGTGWSLYAFTKIYSKDKSSVEKILSLNKNDINSFDRRAADVYHPKADDIADILFITLCLYLLF